jgi:hypothetical protein
MYIYVTRRLLYNKQQLLIPREHLSSPLSFGGIRVAIFLFFCIVLLCVFTFLLPCCDIHYDSCIETMFGSSIPPVVCRRVHDLFTLFVFTHSGAQHLLYCVFCFVCLRLVCCAPSFSRLSVLDCLFGFSNVYFKNIPAISWWSVLLPGIRYKSRGTNLCF